MGLRKKKSLIDQASDYVEAVRPQIESAATTARDEARLRLALAREKAGPVLADARDAAAPVIADARDKAAPLLASGAALASDKAGAAKDRADAGVARLKGESPKKGGKLKKLLIFTGVAAAIGFVAKKMQGGGKSDNWQSSYVPSPPPPSTPRPPSTPPPSPAAPMSGAEVTDDPGGSSPDEAIADAAEEPHPVTTPDDPAEVIEVDGDHKA